MIDRDTVKKALQDFGFRQDKDPRVFFIQLTGSLPLCESNSKVPILVATVEEMRDPNSQALIQSIVWEVQGGIEGGWCAVSITTGFEVEVARIFQRITRMWKGCRPPKKYRPTVEFRLSMPVVKSWDGKWAESDKNFVIYKKGVRAPTLENLKLTGEGKRSYWEHRFSDGSVARVTARILSIQEKPQKSDGFYGYDWMLNHMLSGERADIYNL